MLEVRFLLMLFSLPSRDDAACLFVQVGRDHGHLTTLSQPNCIPAFFRVVETVIEPFEGWCAGSWTEPTDTGAELCR